MTSKLVVKCVLSGVMAAPFYAQAVETEHQHGGEIEHVLVSVPMHKSEAETALPVAVLSGDSLHQSISATIGETLAVMPGLANASFGPAVGQPVIRGQQGPRVTVLQNSTSSADVSNVSADHAVAVESVLAESIEVLKGPSTLLYGGGAIGGVVNVIDHRVPMVVPDSTSAVAESRHNSASDENTTVVKVNTGGGNWALHLNGLLRDSNNVRIAEPAIIDRDGHSDEHANDANVIDNSDANSDSFTVGGSYVFDSGYFGLAINRLNSEYGLPPSFSEEEEDHDDELEEDHAEEHGHGHEDVRLKIDQTRYDLSAQWNDLDNIIDSINWRVTYADYQHREIEEEGVGTVFSNERWENRLELIHQPWQGWSGVVGLQLSTTTFSAVGEESFIPKSNTDNYGLFVVEHYDAGDWLYEVGFRFDREEIDPESVIANQQRFDGFSFSASALWTMNQEWRLGVALSQSERAPVAEELFSNIENTTDFVVHAASQSIEVSDGNLNQEVSKNIDLSLTRSTDSSEVTINLYYNDFNDFIYLDNTGQQQDGVPIYRYSQLGADFFGLELDSNFQLGKLFDGDLSVNLFGDYIRGELENNTDVPRMPPLSVGSRINYDASAFSAYVSVVRANDQRRAGVNEFTTDGYTRWDAGLNYRFDNGNFGEYLAFIKLNNIGDEDIRYSVSSLRDAAPEAGRSIVVGVRVELN
jgi:iron complex outermembrane receptor protein